ncbi:MAG: HEAT repeat domain-containing protein [Methanobacterium sp.]
MIKMGFYDLTKPARQKIIKEIENEILISILNLSSQSDRERNMVPEIILNYSSDKDTYIRKNVYLSIAKIFFSHTNLRETILELLDDMLNNIDGRIRQTSVYALGEIGKKDADSIMILFERALKDKNPYVRNGIIGAMKQMGQKNPKPTFKFARKHLHDDDPRIRMEIVHGIELRGRNYPEEVLPLLIELQNEEVIPVRNMIIHVLGQISYKKGCLEKVIENLTSWKNRELVLDASKEILDVHIRYKFAARTPEYVEDYINKHLINI